MIGSGVRWSKRTRDPPVFPALTLAYPKPVSGAVISSHVKSMGCERNRFISLPCLLTNALLNSRLAKTRKKGNHGETRVTSSDDSNYPFDRSSQLSIRLQVVLSPLERWSDQLPFSRHNGFLYLSRITLRSFCFTVGKAKGAVAEPSAVNGIREKTACLSLINKSVPFFMIAFFTGLC